jgi:hypothetical protein
VNADERLRELIFGGPGIYSLWTIMVILAARADDAGLVDPVEPDEVTEWIRKSEPWAASAIRRLKRDGWIYETSDARWDISVELRGGAKTHP